MDENSGVYFEVVGEGAPLMITLPLFASMIEIFGPDSRALLDGYVEPLKDRYRILLVDYPSIGKSRDIAPEALTADRVCADLYSVADAAGFDRFAYCGYSWGGGVGLQLATRGARINALAIGGWPPLDGPYRALRDASLRKIGNVEPSAMRVLRSADQYRQWSCYLESVLDWPEAEKVAGIGCPKLVFFGGDGDLVEAGVPVTIASNIRANRAALERQGWSVVEFPGHGHEVTTRTDLVVPVIADFFDRSLGVR